MQNKNQNTFFKEVLRQITCGLSVHKDFAFSMALVPIRDRQGQLKIDLILADSDNVVLYEQLKNLPFSQVKKIYLHKDSLIDDKKDAADDENKKGSKRDDLVKHLFKIQTLGCMKKIELVNLLEKLSSE